MKQRGFALVTVVLIIMIMMVMLFGAMSLSSQTVLFIGNFRYRTAALYVAESGIAYAMEYLENNPGHSGPITGSMQNSQGEFSVEVDNQIAGAGKAILISTGRVGMFQRKVKATVGLEAGSFHAIASDGQIAFDGTVFINGISSILNPKLETGNVHTNYSGADGAEAIKALSNNFELYITGKCSAVGSITDAIPDEHKEKTSPVNLADIDKNALLPEGLDNPDSPDYLHNIPYDGIIDANTGHVSLFNVSDSGELGDVVINGLIEIKDGMVLYVKGNLIVNGGIVGNGTVVVEGDTVVKGSMEIKTGNNEGLAFYSEGDVTLAHPLVVMGEDNQMLSGPDPVAEFFAAMPEFAPLYINHNLPPSADNFKGQDFFTWYKNNQSSSDDDFTNWKNGLPDSVVRWLDSSVDIADQISNYNY